MSKFALGTYKIVWEDHHSNIANSLGLDYILMVSLQPFSAYLVLLYRCIATGCINGHLVLRNHKNVNSFLS